MKEFNIGDKLLEVSKAYNKQIIIRAGICAIPYVGGSLDILLSSKGQKIVSNRIENFIKEIQAEISSLKVDQINNDYFESEEGFDLIIAAFNSAVRTRQKVKLNLFAQVIRSVITKDKEFDEDEPELFLKLIEELTVKEFRVAMLLYALRETLKDDPENESLINKQNDMTNDALILSQQNPEFEYEELVSILVRLERTGLVKEMVGSFIGYGGGKYLVNQLFIRFVHFLKL